MTSVDGHRNGSYSGHGLHQSTLLAAGDINESSVVGRVIVGVVVTRLVILKEEEGESDTHFRCSAFPLLPSATYCSQVRIGVLRVQAVVVLDVLESLVHQTTVAALVALRS